MNKDKECDCEQDDCPGEHLEFDKNWVSTYPPMNVIKEEAATPQRKYLPTLSELVDRLSINQLKEFLIPEHKQEYSQEIQDILHDIDLELQEGNIKMNAKSIRAIIVLTIMNREIWLNESSVRKGTKEPSNLLLTHALNAKRNTAKNKIQELVGGRKDYKIDNVTGFPEWDPSWGDNG